MGRKRTPLITVAAALTVALAACGTVEGQAVPDPSVEAQFKLDTGNYRTSPREVKAVTAADAWQQEGWQIAAHVTAPWDVDSATSKSIPGVDPSPLLAASQLSSIGGTGVTVFSPTQVSALGTTPFQAGFATAASGGGKVLRIGLLRYADAAAAQRASDALAGAANSGAGPLPQGITSVPGARLVRRSGDDISKVVTLIAPRTLGTVTVLAIAAVELSPTDPAHWKVDSDQPALVLAGKALDKQYADAAGYKPNPVVGINGGGPSVGMDHDGIMSRTLASTSTADDKGSQLGLSPGVGLGDGWLTVPATLVDSPGAQESVAKMRDTYGFDLLGATSSGQVYRLGDDTRASKFLDEYMLPTKAADIALAGVDAAVGRCGKPSEKKFRCGVVHGRYVAVVSAPTLAQAQQAASASLTILRTAK